MASIGNDADGKKRVLFYSPDGTRKTLWLGKCSKRDAEAVKFRVESILSSLVTTGELSRDDSIWVSSMPEKLRKKFENVGLLEKAEEKKGVPTLASFLDDYMKRMSGARKPGTLEVWRQVVGNLKKWMPDGIHLDEITAGHAKDFHESLKAHGMATTTIHKRIGFARQFFEDAIDRELIGRNPFAKIRTSASSVKSNVFVSRETIDKVIGVCEPTWKLIVALSRYGGLRCPSEVLSLRWEDVDIERKRMRVREPKVEHHEGRGVRECPIFPELMPFIVEARRRNPLDAEFVVNKQAYREAAQTGNGWKNSNLRTQFLKKLAKAQVEPWKRLFHSMRASRQTELEAEFPTHVVCMWLGNSPTIARKSYLLVTDGDFEKASEPRTENSTVNSQNSTESSTASVCDAEQNNAENQGNHRGNGDSDMVYAGEQAEGTGLEPATPYGAHHFQ